MTPSFWFAIGQDTARALVFGALALVVLALLGLPVPGIPVFLALYVLASFVAGFVLPVTILVVGTLVRTLAR